MAGNRQSLPGRFLRPLFADSARAQQLGFRTAPRRGVYLGVFAVRTTCLRVPPGKARRVKLETCLVKHLAPPQASAWQAVARSYPVCVSRERRVCADLRRRFSADRSSGPVSKAESDLAAFRRGRAVPGQPPLTAVPCDQAADRAGIAGVGRHDDAGYRDSEHRVRHHQPPRLIGRMCPNGSAA